MRFEQISKPIQETEVDFDTKLEELSKRTIVEENLVIVSDIKEIISLVKDNHEQMSEGQLNKAFKALETKINSLNEDEELLNNMNKEKEELHVTVGDQSMIR